MKIIRNVIIILYAIIAILVTICLLSYNEYKVSEFGKTSLVIVDSKELEPNFKKGDLLFISKEGKAEIGDEVFFYNTYANEITVNQAKIIGMENVTEKEITYTLEGNKMLSSEYVIGKTENVTKVGFLGTILGILESKWGFLILVVLPALLSFIYEIWDVISGLRKSSKNVGKKVDEK